MKISSIPIEFPKARTQGGLSNATLTNKVAVRQRRVFYYSTRRLVLLDVSAPRARQRSLNEPIKTRTDDAIVLFQFDRTYNDLPRCEYPYKLRLVRPKQIEPTERIKRRPFASYRSQSSGNSFAVANSVANGRA